MRPLEGRLVALLESRMSDEIAAMVRRLGGEPVCAPAVREVPRLEEVDTQVMRLAAGEYQVVIFLTGVGGATLFREADNLGQLPTVLRALEQVTVACRGPKPLAVMKRFGVAVHVVTMKPHTSHELLTAIEEVDLRTVPTLLVRYGERNVDTANALRARGARLDEACPYEWTLPDDPHTLAAHVRDTLEQRLDATAVYEPDPKPSPLSGGRRNAPRARARRVDKPRRHRRRRGPGVRRRSQAVWCDGGRHTGVAEHGVTDHGSRRLLLAHQ
jgi:uroporphyrinogen-III synthase